MKNFYNCYFCSEMTPLLWLFFILCWNFLPIARTIKVDADLSHEGERFTAVRVHLHPRLFEPLRLHAQLWLFSMKWIGVTTTIENSENPFLIYSYSSIQTNCNYPCNCNQDGQTYRKCKYTITDFSTRHFRWSPLHLTLSLVQFNSTWGYVHVQSKLKSTFNTIQNTLHITSIIFNSTDICTVGKSNFFSVKCCYIYSLENPKTFAPDFYNITIVANEKTKSQWTHLWHYSRRLAGHRGAISMGTHHCKSLPLLLSYSITQIKLFPSPTSFEGIPSTLNFSLKNDRWA